MPEKTGIYQFFDKDNNIIYVGKAKNLKKRVNSYFKLKNICSKNKALINKIQDIKFTLVNSEIDALLLENNLIKKYKPRYNVLLKDDKTYPWICISNERVPRIFQTRSTKKNSGEYFGPYISSSIVKTLLGVFSDLFYSNGWTPMSYINRRISSEKQLSCYVSIINDIKKILTGNLSSLIKDLKSEMKKHSNNLEFEQAQIIKDKIDILSRYQSKSVIVSPKITDVDVFSIVSEGDIAFVNFIQIKSGSVIKTLTLRMNKKLNEKDEKLLSLAIVEIRQRFKSHAKKIYCSHHIENPWEEVKFYVPKIGDKKKLIDLSLKNAQQMLFNLKKNKMNQVFKKGFDRVLAQLQKDLNLAAIPKHIECFDNSNLQGTNPISACVVFKNGTPSKKEYRYFNIKTVSGPDDYASMEEVIYRRYLNLLEGKKKLPNLIIIDGGRGQLRSATKSLKKLNLSGRIAVIGIAKRLEEIYFPGDSLPLYLDKRSESLKLIQRLRDEAHRFSITKHRNKRSKNALESSLDKLTGIGPKTIELIISNYGSLKNIRKANKQDVIKLIGKSKTDKIFNN